ncbi:MAG: methyltransferase domain-containing protein [Opitutae bacterium]|nr:methyltransferase domain-containing protein [Opitutae bacterium]
MKSPKAEKNAVRCWCGNSHLADFSPDYLLCNKCQTLVARAMPSQDLSQIRDEEADLYGANYAERHLQEDYGQPDFLTRSRRDLTERCPYWLRALLRYKLPPAELLELGSFHGGFVGLAKLAGFRARGLDLSPALCRKAAAWFDVEVLAGPVESQALAPGSLDVIALFDVLEHLQDPRATLRCCRKLLRPDGLLVIQTPRLREGRTFAEMQKADDPFLPLFIPEHLYLFSQSSVTELLRETGFAHVSFETPIFPQYDMFPFASAVPLVSLEERDQTAALAASAGGKFAAALLDLRAETAGLQQENIRLNQHARRSEGDAKARTEQVETLDLLAKQYKADADARVLQVGELTALAQAQEKRFNEMHAEMNRQLANLGCEVQHRDQIIARLDSDVTTLNQLIHSGELTVDLKDALRRAQLETSLANRLLAQTEVANPSALPVGWLQLPPGAFLPAAAPVVSNLETSERGPDVIHLFGWAFADTPEAVPFRPPYLVVRTATSLWVRRGAAVERPDVAAAFPAEGQAHAARVQSGFAFDLPLAGLPAGAAEAQVLFGQVANTPVMTPPFPLP